MPTSNRNRLGLSRRPGIISELESRFNVMPGEATAYANNGRQNDPPFRPEFRPLTSFRNVYLRTWNSVTRVLREDEEGSGTKGRRAFVILIAAYVIRVPDEICTDLCTGIIQKVKKNKRLLLWYDLCNEFQNLPIFRHNPLLQLCICPIAPAFLRQT